MSSINEFITNSTSTSVNDLHDTQAFNFSNIHFCQWILYKNIGIVGIRIWDILIFIPNLIFLLILAFRFKSNKIRLRNAKPIFITSYTLICIDLFISTLRCILSFILHTTTDVPSELDKLFWVITRFFLLSTEMLVLVFCFSKNFGRTTIRLILLITFLISCLYSFTQGSLEIFYPDKNFYMPEIDSHLFGHGGIRFWSQTCALFTITYLIIFLLPWTPLKYHLYLPGYSSFYVYIFIIFTLNLIQTIGIGLYNEQIVEGICMFNVTTYLYFSFFTPLAYWICLAKFFNDSQLNFLYNNEIDNNLISDDVIVSGFAGVSLPHQLSFSSVRTDTSDFLYQQKITAPFDNRNDTLYQSYSFSPDSIESHSVN